VNPFKHPFEISEKGEHMNDVDLQIPSRTFAKYQFLAIAFLLLAGAAGYVLRNATGPRALFDIIRFFDLGSETSLPTYLSALNLLIAAFLLAVVARTSRRERPDLFRYWTILSFGFLYLSLDEATIIHETLGKMYNPTALGLAVLDSHKWLLIGIPAALVAAAVCTPFLFKLPRRTALRFLLAGTIFLGGALGLELVGALMIYTDFAVRGDFIYDLRRVVEEGCEMFGIAYFNYILVGELAGKRFTLEFKGSESSASSG
jgi:hypothetical protein